MTSVDASTMLQAASAVSAIKVSPWTAQVVRVELGFGWSLGLGGDPEGRWVSPLSFFFN